MASTAGGITGTDPMSTPRRFAPALALAAGVAATSLACGAGRSAAPAPSVDGPTPTVAPASAAVPAAAPVTSPTTTAAPALPASDAPAPVPSASAEPDPPCIEGEVLMGACICNEKGKAPDATGHCVYVPCPSITPGGTPFRDEKTGQCMECRAGTKPTKDGRCEP